MGGACQSVEILGYTYQVCHALFPDIFLIPWANLQLVGASGQCHECVCVSLASLHLQYFASGLAQNGVEQSNTINGFLLEDIRQELRRGLRITCSGCHKAGGYVGCAVKTCRKAGHFPCLQRLGYTLQYSENFKAYCPSHRPTQPKLRHSKDSTECCICLSHFTPGNRIYCPCCLTVFHKTCVEVRHYSKPHSPGSTKQAKIAI